MFRASPIKLNLKGTPQFPPPTWNPWNGCSGHCWCQTKTSHQNKKSPPKVDLLFSCWASTGELSYNIDKRGRYSLEPYSPRFDSRSKKNKKTNKMKYKDSPVPWKRKNKFPVSMPWIFPMSSPWRFPRLTPPNRTEPELIVWKMKNFFGRRNGRALIWRRRIRSISGNLFNQL